MKFPSEIMPCHVLAVGVLEITNILKRDSGIQIFLNEDCNVLYLVENQSVNKHTQISCKTLLFSSKTLHSNAQGDSLSRDVRSNIRYRYKDVLLNGS